MTRDPLHTVRHGQTWDQYLTEQGDTLFQESNGRRSAAAPENLSTDLVEHILEGDLRGLVEKITNCHEGFRQPNELSAAAKWVNAISIVGEFSGQFTIEGEFNKGLFRTLGKLVGDLNGSNPSLTGASFVTVSPEGEGVEFWNDPFVKGCAESEGVSTQVLKDFGKLLCTSLKTDTGNDLAHAILEQLFKDPTKLPPGLTTKKQGNLTDCLRGEQLLGSMNERGTATWHLECPFRSELLVLGVPEAKHGGGIHLNAPSVYAWELSSALKIPVVIPHRERLVLHTAMRNFTIERDGPFAEVYPFDGITYPEHVARNHTPDPTAPYNPAF